MTSLSKFMSMRSSTVGAAPGTPQYFRDDYVRRVLALSTLMVATAVIGTSATIGGLLYLGQQQAKLTRIEQIISEPSSSPEAAFDELSGYLQETMPSGLSSAASENAVMLAELERQLEETLATSLDSSTPSLAG